jgi:hypothetical protein
MTTKIQQPSMWWGAVPAAPGWETVPVPEFELGVDPTTDLFSPTRTSPTIMWATSRDGVAPIAALPATGRVVVRSPDGRIFAMDQHKSYASEAEFASKLWAEWERWRISELERQQDAANLAAAATG